MLSELVNEIDPRLFQDLTPAAPVLLAGALAALTPIHVVRKGLMLAAPFAALALWMNATFGAYGAVDVLQLELVTFRYDGLSRVFGLVFIFACFVNALFALHERSRLQDAAALVYGGAALGAVFAGDLVTLFVFWELAAASSALLVWARGTRASVNAGLRYLAIHAGSGVLLLAGLVLVYADTGSIAFDAQNPATAGGLLILLAFGIKAAFPFLHNWLQDAYPKATVTGAVVLSAFTTKMAVYALARGFAGFEPLVWIGAAMTCFPVFFAVVENDLRRVLSYSINNQAGFMVCGVGLAGAGVVAGELAMNGVAAHAVADVIFKGLLFMSIGAVLHRTGTARATDLGGLYRTMPFTAVFCMIGAASISALPLFSAFVTKSLILAAAAEQGRWLVWLMLLFASAGVLEHAGIKVPFFAFFAHDSGMRPKEAPMNMLWAMFLSAVLCIYIGVRPDVLYGFLPFDTGYVPYTLDHVVTQAQLVLAAAFAFVLLYRSGLYPPERRVIILDSDWVYRRLGARLVIGLGERAADAARAAQEGAERLAARVGRGLEAVLGPGGMLSRAFPAGLLAASTALLLGLAMLIAYLAPL
jgi:multicomponent Na+:H+ antiporter subunit D